MGDGFVHGGISEVLFALNARFAPGKPLAEMVKIQKEFQVFSEKHSLEQSYRLLHIVPRDFTERRLFFRFLNKLKEVPSDIPGLDGHSRIIKARQENLEAEAPLPTFTKTHTVEENPGVTVNEGRPLAHEKQIYQIVSVPVIPA